MGQLFLLVEHWFVTFPDSPWESKDGTAPEDLKRNLAGRLDELRDCSMEGCRDAEWF